MIISDDEEELTKQITVSSASERKSSMTEGRNKLGNLDRFLSLEQGKELGLECEGTKKILKHTNSCYLMHYIYNNIKVLHENCLTRLNKRKIRKIAYKN